MLSSISNSRLLVHRNLKLPQQAQVLFRREFCNRNSRSEEEDEEREFHVLRKAHSINSGVALSRAGSIEQEELEQSRKARMRKSLLVGDVHGSYRTMSNVETWRKRPLFKRSGKNLTFSSGEEAANLLVDEARRRDPYQIDFLQCVQELATDVAVTIEQAPKLAWVFKQLMEPERLITFRVPWIDDNSNARINRGYRIQYSSALGPYHGGIRFNSSLSHGSLRMLGWEQTMKNCLTGFDIGGSRGGSDFDPSNKSEAEIKRFCSSFMTELFDFIGPEVDSLDYDLGVGSLEMTALRERYRELEEMDDGDPRVTEGSVFPAIQFPNASGFGSVYFAERALEMQLGTNFQGKRCMFSGSNTLARSTALKVIDKGGIPITFSDSSGYIVDKSGFTEGDIENIAHFKAGHGSLKEYAKAAKCEFVSTGSLWEQVKGEIAFPSNIQGELNADDAVALADSGTCIAVFENSDRALTPNAQLVLMEKPNILFAPSKIVNTGSVIAGLDCAGKTAEELDRVLQEKMPQIHDTISETAEKYGVKGNLRAGANLTAFIRIANSDMYISDMV